MCGIAGFIGNKIDGARDILADMSSSVRHRGPDADGFSIVDFDNGRNQVAFAHRRLAIIDLNASSNQPMAIEDGRLHIVFNGEIYNYIELRDELTGLGHVFATGSDTEVLLRAYDQWQLSMFERLNGMFAFALWDAQRRQLILARDPFGEKPLYMMQTNGLLSFASEVSALLALSDDARRIDPCSVHEYLMWRYVPGPATLFKEIRKLNPGSYAVWSEGELRETRYYIPPDQTDVTEDIDQASAESRFLHVLERSVQIRMRSDAPFGAFLSGGLDSSAVVALMARNGNKAVRTFAVGFHESDQSELPFARRVADHFNTSHTELVIKADDLMDHLPAMVRHRGGPVSQASDIPVYLMARRAAEDVKMVLTGEGSDEILAGYPKHRAESLARFYRSIVPSFAHNGLLAPTMRSLLGRSAKLETFARTAGERDFARRMVYWFGAITADRHDELIGVSTFNRYGRSRFPFSSSLDQSHLRRVLFFDQTSWLPDNLLERADRMMMAGSIEGRMPFLDRDLVALVSALPDRFKLGRRYGKQILRDVMKPILPPEVLTRKKVGFHVPTADWFRGKMKDYVREHLCSSQSIIRRYLNPSSLDRVVQDHVAGEANLEKLIWALLNLEIFHREFRIGGP